MENKRPILKGHVGKDGYFECPKSFTVEDEVRWAKNRMRSTRIAQYADESCGLPHTYDKDGAYLCGGRADGGSEPCNMLQGSECLIRIKLLPAPHTTSCMWWEKPNAGDPEGRLCPKGKLDDERLDFGPTKNPKGFGCIRCEYGQQMLLRPDSEGRKRWCEVKDHSVADNSCCADNEPEKGEKEKPAKKSRSFSI